MYDEYDDYEDSACDFAEPGSGSALRAATHLNPRNIRCPTCKWPNRLTPADVRAGYQCNSCADACERDGEINYNDAYWDNPDPEDL